MLKKKDMIAIIPARGGSKSLPRKNILTLGNKPLIAHTISAALSSKTVCRVIVSTDDPEIANISIEHGAEVPFMRPADLADDHSMVMDAYLYTVSRLGNDLGKQIDKFIALLPTAPFRTAEDIDAAVNIFYEKSADSVVSVTESKIPIQWYRRIDTEGVLHEFLPGFDAVRNRQNYEKTYVPNGAIYIFRTDILRKTRKYYTEKTYAYIMPKERSVDIDEKFDFLWAGFLLEINLI